VAANKETADHLTKLYGKVFEGTYAREVPEDSLWDLGFTTFGPVSCGAEWNAPECAADGRWRALVSLGNPKLPPNATGPGQFEGRDVQQATFSGVPVIHASLPEQKSVEVSWHGRVVSTVDVTAYEDQGPGSLYMMEGKEPIFAPYRLPHDFNVESYWGFALRDIGGAENYGPDAVGEE